MNTPIIIPMSSGDGGDTTITAAVIVVYALIAVLYGSTRALITWHHRLPFRWVDPLKMVFWPIAAVVWFVQYQRLAKERLNDSRSQTE
jgi:hypothetical protein